MQTFFFLIQGFIKLFDLGHIHIDAEQTLNVTILVEHTVSKRADMANAIFNFNAILYLERQALPERVAHDLFGVG